MKTKLRNYIKNNIGKGERITVALAIQAIGCSLHEFKYNLIAEGVKFSDIRGLYEMEFAASSIEEGLSRKEISKKLGFGTEPGLAYAFRKNYGVTMAQYWQEFKNIEFKLKHGH